MSASVNDGLFAGDLVEFFIDSVTPLSGLASSFGTLSVSCAPELCHSESTWYASEGFGEPGAAPTECGSEAGGGDVCPGAGMSVCTMGRAFLVVRSNAMVPGR